MPWQKLLAADRVVAAPSTLARAIGLYFFTDLFTGKWQKPPAIAINWSIV